jgi:hypothetical protein
MMGSVLTSVFVWLFAFACLSTFLCGMRKEWRMARIASTVIAILFFALALAAASAKL